MRRLTTEAARLLMMSALWPASRRSTTADLFSEATTEGAAHGLKAILGAVKQR